MGDEPHRARTAPSNPSAVARCEDASPSAPIRKRYLSNPVMLRPSAHRRTAAWLALRAGRPAPAKEELRGGSPGEDEDGDGRPPGGGPAGNDDRPAGAGHFAALMVGAVGVVFGDIGTSPLYTFSGIFVDVLDTDDPTPRDVADAFSMIFWALTLVVGFKYVCVIMAVSHHGEGGTFAMMHKILEGAEKAGKPISGMMKSTVTFLSMLGLSLIAGDGCITPAISVLSALNGIPVPINSNWQVALAVVILVAIFLMQRHGSRLIGLFAGPIMICWFLSIAALGVYNLALHPQAARLVAHALNPRAFADFWIKGKYSGVNAWRSLAGVVLSVTGAEALYADMGHFGRGPLSVAWFTLVYPCLVLQYMGQAAALCADGRGVVNPFYHAVPGELKWPMVILSTLATVVASQAMISGLFSLVTQAHAFRFVPRILVHHTNPDQQGQVYIPEVNWALCVACVAICVCFRSSDRLAGAYGITVTSTFLVSTILLWIVLRRVWCWHLVPALALIVPLLVIDMALWSANMLKIVDSGWVPVVISVFSCFLMHTHLWGRKREEIVMARQLEAEVQEMKSRGVPENLATISTLPGLQAALGSQALVRTDKAAVFLTPYEWRVPRTVGALATLLGCLPRTVVLLSISFEKVPFISEEHRADLKAHASGVFTVVLHFGYAEPLVAERLAVHKALARLAREHCGEHPDLKALANLDQVGERIESQGALPGPDMSNEASTMEAGRAHTAPDDGSTGTLSLRGSTFVVSKVIHAVLPEAGHGSWNRLRIAVYSFIVLNARQSIRFLGLEGEDTVEVSVVRFL